jgi:hypothetical protein
VEPKKLPEAGSHAGQPMVSKCSAMMFVILKESVVKTANAKQTQFTRQRHPTGYGLMDGPIAREGVVFILFQGALAW